MKLRNALVGDIDVSPDRIIEFPAGLPGFESCRLYTLIHEEGTAAKVLLLQSLDDPELHFSVTTPEVLGLNYEFGLGDDEAAKLELGQADDATVLVMVRRQGEGAGPVQANLMSPLVINPASRKGMQKIISRMDANLTLKAVA